MRRREQRQPNDAEVDSGSKTYRDMPWQSMPGADVETVALFRRAKRSRFLIDESLGSGARMSWNRGG
jgi:hypothetical protein